MAYVLKGTGLATNLIACLVVDEDGSTIVDLCGNTISAHGSLPAVSSATWKGVSRGHIVTGGDGFYTPYGISWSGTKPTVNTNDSDGIGVFVAAAGASAKTGGAIGNFVYIDSDPASTVDRGLYRDGSNKAVMKFTASSGGVSTTSIPTDDTKFSMAANYRNEANVENFYGLESGSLASDSTATNPGNWGSASYVLHSIGGMSGQNTQPFKPFIVAVFDRELTLSEYQSLHNDWFGVLIDSGSSSATITLTDPVAVVTGSTASCTITRSTAAVGNITYNLVSSNPANATVPATATIADGQTIGTFNITGVSAGSSTITATNAADSGETDTATANVSALKGLEITFGQANLSGLTFAWFDEASPDLFAAPTVVGTTEATDGSGVMSITLTGTSVAVGNTGYLLIYKAGATAPDDIAFFGRMTVQDIG